MINKIIVNNEIVYSALRSEIVSSIEIQNHYILYMYTISVTILGFALNNKEPYLFLLPYMVLIPFQSQINSKSEGMIKIAAYIEVFLENNNGWEHVNYIVAEKCKTKNNKSFFSKMIRNISRTGAIQLGFICSVSACLSYLFVQNKNFLDLAIRDSFLFFISVGLFTLLCFVNKKGIKTNKVHEFYLPIMENIKKINSNYDK